MSLVYSPGTILEEAAKNSLMDLFDKLRHLELFKSLFWHFFQPSSHNSSKLFYLAASLHIIPVLVSPTHRQRQNDSLTLTCYFLTPICCISKDMIISAISADVSHLQPTLNSSYSLASSIYFQKLSAYLINKASIIFPRFQMENLKW